jgi:DNA repair protein RadA/Sms
LPLPTTTVVVGEVGLAGDLRQVTGMERRLAEAARLGFTTALVPDGVYTVPKGIYAMHARTIDEALDFVREIAVKPTRATTLRSLELVEESSGGP